MSRQSMKAHFAAIFLVVLNHAWAAEALVLEQFLLQTTTSGSARVIGIIRNSSSDLIVLPVLEVTCTTKEEPASPKLHRLVMTACLRGRESRAFHTGEFFGPPIVTSDGDSRPQRIAEIKSCRILPGSMIPASADWNRRIAGREEFIVQGAKIDLQHGERWLSGTIVASPGAKIQSAQFTAAYFDAKGGLVDVRTFPVRSRNGKCVDSFPFRFTARAGPDDLQIVPASVKCDCEQVDYCQ